MSKMFVDVNILIMWHSINLYGYFCNDRRVVTPSRVIITVERSGVSQNGFAQCTQDDGMAWCATEPAGDAMAKPVWLWQRLTTMIRCGVCTNKIMYVICMTLNIITKQMMCNQITLSIDRCCTGSQQVKQKKKKERTRATMQTARKSRSEKEKKKEEGNRIRWLH